MTTTRIAAVAFPGTYNLSESIDRHISNIDQSMASGAELVCFPECSLHGYPPELWDGGSAERIMEVYQRSEPIDGPSSSAIIAHAIDRKIHVAFGLHERGDARGVVYNTMVIAGPNGVIGSYRKVHLGVIEHIYWRPGNSFPVFETALGRIGICICSDLMLPEVTRELTLGGADILIWATAWDLNLDGQESYELLTRTRAYENFRWLVSANYVGTLGPGVFGGASRIVDPQGRVVESVPPDVQGIAAAAIDVLDGIQAANARLNRQWLQYIRRPELYRLTGVTEVLP